MADIVIKVGNPNYTLSIRRPKYTISVGHSAVSIAVNKPNYAFVVKKPQVSISVTQKAYSIGVSKKEYTISLGRGTQGPIGPAGGSIVIYPAGENLSAGRVVIIDGGEAFYFQPSDLSHSGRAFGITATSATTGNNVSIYAIGEATDAAFLSFADVPLYVGDDGELQTNWPGSGIIQKAGFGTGTNKVRIDFSVQIQQTA